MSTLQPCPSGSSSTTYDTEHVEQMMNDGDVLNKERANSYTLSY